MQENILKRLSFGISFSGAKDYFRSICEKYKKQKGMSFKYGFFGDYVSWEEASKDSEGWGTKVIFEKFKDAFLKVKKEEVIYARDAVTFDKIEYIWPVLSSLMWIAANNNGKLNLVDFGGSLGASYFQNRLFLQNLKEVHWNIIEQKHFVECGKMYFEDKQLRFYEDIESCLKEQPANAILISGVIQYLQKPYDFLQYILSKGFEYIIFAETPFLLNGKSRITVQRVSPAVYEASFPCHFFNLKEFLAFFPKGYSMIAEFDGFEKAENIESSLFKGFIFKRNKDLQTVHKETYSSDDIQGIIRRMSLNQVGRHVGISRIEAISEDAKILLAKILINKIKEEGILANIQEAEFKVFSQFADDGIIQYLVHFLKIEPQTFIEFGVEKYTESNTRFLLMNNNWKGLVIDCNKTNIGYIRNDGIYWRYNLIAEYAFVSKNNINSICIKNNFKGEIGILNIDIDGNDYWIWEAITAVSPVLVIIEYNSVFGDKFAVTIPYNPRFNRTKAHYSNLYWGASLRALVLLAEKKGYCFIGSNSSGTNAYFVRQDRIGRLKSLEASEGYIESKYRESRNRISKLTYLSDKERLCAIEDMPVYDTERGIIIKIKDLEAKA